MPAPSWPRIDGKMPAGSAPDSVYLSVWQMPDALISTSTSPALGPSSCTVSIDSGWPASNATAARTSMGKAPDQGKVAIENSASGVAPTHGGRRPRAYNRSEEHTSELQSLMRISYAVFCLKKKKRRQISNTVKKNTEALS